MKINLGEYSIVTYNRNTRKMEPVAFLNLPSPNLNYPEEYNLEWRPLRQGFADWIWNSGQACVVSLSGRQTILHFHDALDAEPSRFPHVLRFLVLPRRNPAVYFQIVTEKYVKLRSAVSILSEYPGGLSSWWPAFKNFTSTWPWSYRAGGVPSTSTPVASTQRAFSSSSVQAPYTSLGFTASTTLCWKRYTQGCFAPSIPSTSPISAARPAFRQVVEDMHFSCLLSAC